MLSSGRVNRACSYTSICRNPAVSWSASSTTAARYVGIVGSSSRRVLQPTYCIRAHVRPGGHTGRAKMSYVLVVVVHGTHKDPQPQAYAIHEAPQLFPAVRPREVLWRDRDQDRGPSKRPRDGYLDRTPASYSRPVNSDSRVIVNVLRRAPGAPPGLMLVVAAAMCGPCCGACPSCIGATAGGLLLPMVIREHPDKPEN